MPLSIEDFKVPKFVKQAERKPFGEDTKDKFYATDNTLKGIGNERRYRSGSFPQQGYNVNDNKAVPSDININSDNYTVRPY